MLRAIIRPAWLFLAVTACTADVDSLGGRSDGGGKEAGLRDAWSSHDGGQGPSDAVSVDGGDADAGLLEPEAGTCDGPWRTRRFPEAVTATVADFLLESHERLFLDVEIGGVGPKGPNIGIDVVDLSSGSQAAHLRGEDGVVRIVASGGTRQMVVQYRADGRWGDWSIDILTQGVWRSPLWYQDVIDHGQRQGVVGDDFVALVGGVFPESPDVFWQDEVYWHPLGGRSGVFRFEADGRRTAALTRELPADRWAIEMFDRVNLIAPVWVHSLAEPPPERVNDGPWLSGDTVLYREQGLSYTYTLGDSAPALVMEDPDCHPMDLEDGAALFGCGRVPDAPVPAFERLRWRRDAHDVVLAGVAGVVTEARLVQAEQVVWREWDNAAALCSGTTTAAGRVKVLDVLEADPALVLGTSHAPCACCEPGAAPMRLLVWPGVVAWSHAPPQAPSGPTTVGVADQACH
jgi:hypothetical protein